MIGGLKRKLLNSRNNILLHNKYVLYLLNFIALVILFHLLFLGDVFHVILFFLIGFLTQFFCKNMMVILFTAILCISILKYGFQINLEGMNGMDSEEGSSHPEDTIESSDNYMDDSTESDKKKKNQ